MTVYGYFQGIPRNFVRKYGNQLSSPVKLEVPNGAICVFELIRQPEILMKVQIYPAAKNASNACRSQADNSIASQLRTGSLVSVTEPDCQQTRCPYSSSELKDSKLKTQKNIDFQNSTKELKGNNLFL
ncbi:uncharacterized protein [Gossypium hirsutum]|uniref:Uncharacterized protein n=1 Tax=Gossypium hirsutum TaxID=3635 RepID=A0ABM2ZBD0_GOSHI|nr:uncharacterized protein LOC121211343 [Gossypium hirsutum]